MKETCQFQEAVNLLERTVIAREPAERTRKERTNTKERKGKEKKKKGKIFG